MCLSIIPAMHKGKLVKLFVSCIITQSQIYNEWLASCFGHFTNRKDDTNIHSWGGWVCPTNPDWPTITANLSIYLVYFTFCQIFTDMEEVIVIHRSTWKCAEHLSQHNLQEEKNMQTTFHISWNTCSSCPLTLHICSHTGCLTFSAGTMKKVSILYLFRISLRVLPWPGMYRYLLSSRSSVSLVTWTFLKDEKLPFYPIR
jgi:hypothetical protein